MASGELPDGEPLPRPGWRSTLALLAVFAATRLVARAGCGLRFSADTLGYWQVLDPQLLRHDLLRSVFYLHGQPPLYNLFLGVVLKLAPAQAAGVFDALFLAIGFALLLGFHALLLELGTPRRPAFAATCLQAVSTTWIVYESWLFYTLPTAALLTWTAVWLARAARGSRPALIAFALAVATVAGLRSTYHLAWVAAALALLVVLVRPHLALRRTAWAASAVALALVVGLYAKNALLVGSFSSSSWLGMSLARLTSERLDPATRAWWVASGRFGPVVAVKPFSPLADYPSAPPLRELPPHPSLSAAVKSDGNDNFNHAAYVRIAREYARGAAAVIRERPAVYLAAVRDAWLIWLRPPTDYEFVAGLRHAVRRWDRLHSLLLLWSHRGPEGSGPTWVLLPAALLVAVAVALPPRGERRQRLLLVALPLLTILTNAVVGNFAEIEENNRFRVEVEPLVWALASWAAIDCGRRLRSSWRTSRRARP